MSRPDKIRLTRRDMVKLGAGGAGMFMLSAGGLAVPRGFAGGGSGGGGSLYIEAFPTSPLILKPFSDPMNIPKAMAPVDPTSWDSIGKDLPDPKKQDCLPVGDAKYQGRYGYDLGCHQMWPGEGASGKWDGWKNYKPLVYQIKAQVAGHKFTSSPVQPINSFGKNVTPPRSANPNPRKLPESTIYGFNGTFPGPRINAEYGQAALVRFENHLDKDNGYDRQDFGAPNYSLLTHLHNGHTAPESDGQPHYASYRFGPMGRYTHEAAWEPGEYVDQLYLGYPAGGDDREKQSFFWFHDHVHGFTGANVYKGMVGLMPIYDPKLDNGDETDPNGLRLPGRRTNNEDGSFDVDYDIPMALFDARLDDGVTPHKDAHNGNGETHPEWWGKTYFRHFPNHGFVGDIFTVNGTAFPVLNVYRRKYRFRFLGASVSRIYELMLMRGTPTAAPGTQGQYQIPDGQQCHQFTQIASEGGLLPKPITRDSFQIWPAKRREVVVDFTKFLDGTPTSPGDVLYLVNVLEMPDGRKPNFNAPGIIPTYKVPIMKIVIGGNPPEPDVSVVPKNLRNMPNLPKNQTSLPQRTFTLERSGTAGGETQWVINGLEFNPTTPLALPSRSGAGEIWTTANGGGGWVHPMHMHQEEHTVLERVGSTNPHPDDTVKEDFVPLDPS